MVDEFAKFVYSISEPRWFTDQDSKMISDLRHRIYDIYAKFRGISSRSTH